MTKILKLWEELRFPENWSNEEVISKINELIEWTYKHDSQKKQTNDPDD